jgi:hypothetical protein
MTADSSWAVQSAVYIHLAITSALTSLLGNGAAGVHDHVPPDAPFPYIVLGESSARPLETQGGDGYDITLTIHSYSRENGMKQLRGIMAAVHDALHHNTALTPAGHHLILCDEISADVRLEADGITRHGLQRYRIATEPEN